MARPRKTIDESRVIELASKGHSNNHIAAILGVSHDTLERNFAESLKKGRVLRDGRLQAKQFELAMSGNVTMLIWLGKVWLKQREQERAGEPQPVRIIFDVDPPEQGIAPALRIPGPPVQ